MQKQIFGSLVIAALAIAPSAFAKGPAGHCGKDMKACKESNSCKGKGSCAGFHGKDKNSCSGKNTCKGATACVKKDAECPAAPAPDAAMPAEAAPTK
jgi:hypothetical protein